jgi:hypothetical protein
MGDRKRIHKMRISNAHSRIRYHNYPNLPPKGGCSCPCCIRARSKRYPFKYTMLTNIDCKLHLQLIGGLIHMTLCILVQVYYFPCGMPFLSCDRTTESVDGQMLLRDLLSVHMVRSIHGSTIISYHPNSESGRTSAKNLQSRVHLAGKSVYWANIFNHSCDPTFLLLTIFVG